MLEKVKVVACITDRALNIVWYKTLI